MKKANSEKLKVTSATLRAVRKLSGVAFSKKLSGFDLIYTVNREANVLSLYVTNNGKYCDIFNVNYMEDKTPFYQTTMPAVVNDIKRFELEVEACIATVFEFIKGVK